MGMGHVEVVSCDLETHLLFYRPDGGSNSYDREANYQRYELKMELQNIINSIFRNGFINIKSDK